MVFLHNFSRKEAKKRFEKEEGENVKSSIVCLTNIGKGLNKLSQWVSFEILWPKSKNSKVGLDELRYFGRMKNIFIY